MHLYNITFFLFSVLTVFGNLNDNELNIYKLI